MAKLKLRKFVKEIHKGSLEETEDYGSGLLNEHLIVSSFKKATSEQLKGYRIIINKILNNRRIAKLNDTRGDKNKPASSIINKNEAI